MDVSVFLFFHIFHTQQADRQGSGNRHIMAVLIGIRHSRHGNLQFSLFPQRQFIDGAILNDNYRHAQSTLDTQPFCSGKGRFRTLSANENQIRSFLCAPGTHPCQIKHGRFQNMSCGIRHFQALLPHIRTLSENSRPFYFQLRLKPDPCRAGAVPRRSSAFDTHAGQFRHDGLPSLYCRDNASGRKPRRNSSGRMLRFTGLHSVMGIMPVPAAEKTGQ